VRNSVPRNNRSLSGAAESPVADERPARWSVFRRLGWSYRDAAGCIVGVAVACAILINALFLQSGPHPAPIFNSAPIPVAAIATNDVVVGGVPRSREPAPAKSEPVAVKSDPIKVETPAPTRPVADVISDIQRELARRGFYDGPIDGVHGAKTGSAIREFEQAAGLKASAEPNAALLKAIARSNVKAAKAPPPTPPTTVSTASRIVPPPPTPTTVATGAGRPVPPARIESAAGPAVSSRRVIAVQRALAEFGYGQLKPTGMIDRETRTAVEKFERAHKLPVTGQISDRLVRDIAALSGHAVD
jgi:peptidoglycan hydrolase-like protein with peptidoglycan-binding domain